MEKISKKVLYIVFWEMENQKITQEEMAKRLDCSRRSIEYWKNGKRNISLNMAEKVLNVLGYELSIKRKE